MLIGNGGNSSAGGPELPDGWVGVAEAGVAARSDPPAAAGDVRLRLGIPPPLVSIRFPVADDAMPAPGKGGAPSPDVNVRPEPDETGVPDDELLPIPEPVAPREPVPTPVPRPFCERNGCSDVGTCGGSGVGAGPIGPIGAGIGGRFASSALGGGFGLVGSGTAGARGLYGIIGPSGRMWCCLWAAWMSRAWM